MDTAKIIIYDDSCPLCAAYTGAFVKTGFIKKEDRLDFSHLDENIKKLLDTSRCPNEIPVIDRETLEVSYGIDALATILDQKFHGIKKLIGYTAVNWPLQKLYKFISYNRRVIVAAKPAAGSFDCTPDFNVPYRVAFMMLFLVFNSLMLFPIHVHILQNSLSRVSSTQVQVAHLLLVTLNIGIAACMKLKPALEYLGQINMLALTTIIATLPLMLLNYAGLVPFAGINNIYLFLLIGFVLKEYRRRMIFAEIIPGKKWVYTLNISGILLFIFFLLQGW